MKIALATLFALLLASPVFAAGEDKAYQAKFHELDTDRSGTLSFEEVEAIGVDSETFNQHDIDGDGVLNEEEFKALKRGSGREESQDDAME